MGHGEPQTGEHTKTAAETAITDSMMSETASQGGTGHENDSGLDHSRGRPQLLHGPFSYCICLGCMEDAKKEAEKRLGNDTFAFEYIKKLEGLVTRLQIQANGDDSFDPCDEVYHKGRMRRRSSLDSGKEHFDYSKFAGSAGPSGPCHVPEDAVVVDADDTHNNRGPKVEVRRMKNVPDRYGNPKIERDRTSPNVLTSVDLSNEYVLSVTREYDRMKNYWRRILEIHSPPFIELLRGIAHSNVDLPAPDSVLCLKEPLMPLFHNRTKLTKYLQVNKSDTETLLLLRPGNIRDSFWTSWRMSVKMW